MMRTRRKGGILVHSNYVHAFTRTLTYCTNNITHVECVAVFTFAYTVVEPRAASPLAKYYLYISRTQKL